MSSFPPKKQTEIVLKPTKRGLINKINALYYNNNYLGAIWYNKVHLHPLCPFALDGLMPRKV